MTTITNEQSLLEQALNALLLPCDRWNGVQSKIVKEAAGAVLSALAAPATAPEQCWCRTCRPITQADNRMVLCPDCGNKRCPKATDHRNACTGSNEPGQPGSSYPTVPATAPDWHDAPTCAGLWMRIGRTSGDAALIRHLESDDIWYEGYRWFGPITPDSGDKK